MEKTEPPCAQKLTYDNQMAAQAAATTLEWQRDVKLKPYRCRHCDLWHLTSQPD